MAAITGWSSKMSFQRNKSKNNHDKDSNGRSTSPGGYSVSQLFGSSPKRRSPPQRSATTQQLSSTPPKYDDTDLSSNRSTPTPTAAVPVPPGRTFMKVKLPSSSAAASAVTVGNNSPLIKDSHSPSSGMFLMNQGKLIKVKDFYKSENRTFIVFIYCTDLLYDVLIVHCTYCTILIVLCHVQMYGFKRKHYMRSIKINSSCFSQIVLF